MSESIPARRCDILVPGHHFCDLIFTGIPCFPALGAELYAGNLSVVPGGGALNTVTALRRLGVDAGWLGVVGSDLFSRIIDEWVTQEGIDRRWLITVDQPFQRVTVALSYPQDRAFVTYVEQEPNLLDRVFAAVAADECAHIHFHRMLIDERIPDLLRACRSHGITVSMDCQHRLQPLTHALVREIISLLDIFMPNASEAQRLTETSNLEDAAVILRDLVPLLVIKDGERGSWGWRGDEQVHAPAMHVEVVDTTGAGDVFNAGFLAVYRAGSDLLTCLRWGNICGGLSTTGYGGCSTAPTRAEVENRLQNSRVDAG